MNRWPEEEAQEKARVAAEAGDGGEKGEGERLGEGEFVGMRMVLMRMGDHEGGSKCSGQIFVALTVVDVFCKHVGKRKLVCGKGDRCGNCKFFGER